MGDSPWGHKVSTRLSDFTFTFDLKIELLSETDLITQAPLEALSFLQLVQRRGNHKNFEAREASHPQFIEIQMKGDTCQQRWAVTICWEVSGWQQGNRDPSPAIIKKHFANNLDQFGRGFIPSASKKRTHLGQHLQSGL